MLNYNELTGVRKIYEKSKICNFFSLGFGTTLIFFSEFRNSLIRKWLFIIRTSARVAALTMIPTQGVLKNILKLKYIFIKNIIYKKQYYIKLKMNIYTYIQSFLVVT